MFKKPKTILIILVAFVLVSQVIPIELSNPPVTAELTAPDELMTIFKRSCYDCHSNESIWPWYSHIAPVSWLVAFDVSEGRGHLNFSTWGDYDGEKQLKLKKKTWKAVDEGEMPPLWYYPAHLDARLSEQDKKVIRSWSESETN